MDSEDFLLLPSFDVFFYDDDLENNWMCFEELLLGEFPSLF